MRRCLEITRGEFVRAHGPGGEHHESPPRGIGSGLGAAPEGSSTSRSSLSGGLPPGTLEVVIGEEASTTADC